MSAPRKFDHDEARLRHAAGERVADLAREYGVSKNAVYEVVSARYRAGRRAFSLRWQQAGTCPACGGPASRQGGGRTHRCRSCWAKAQTKVRDGEAFCPACDTWKPLADFTASRPQVARGVRGECRACDTARRRAYRAAHRQATRAYDRERRRKRAAA